MDREREKIRRDRRDCSLSNVRYDYATVKKTKHSKIERADQSVAKTRA